MKIGLEYIKYLWNLKSMYRSDSAFISDFFNKCLQIDIDQDSKTHLTSLFSRLKNDHRTISISDFGAGSKKLGDRRKVSTIFKTSSSKGKYGKLLYQLSKYYNFRNILELGTSLGVGTTYMSLGNPTCKISTIEACDNTRSLALENLESLTNITSFSGTFDLFLTTLSSRLEEDNNAITYDFVFIDGHHDGIALLDYIKRLEKFTNKDTIYVLDDIRWSDSMFDAWNQIKKDTRFEAIDLFRVGIIKATPTLII